MASAPMASDGWLSPSAVQVTPPSCVRHTPPRLVPMKMVLAVDRMRRDGGDAAADQDAGAAIGLAARHRQRAQRRPVGQRRIHRRRARCAAGPGRSRSVKRLQPQERRVGVGRQARRRVDQPGRQVGALHHVAAQGREIQREAADQLFRILLVATGLRCSALETFFAVVFFAAVFLAAARGRPAGFWLSYVSSLAWRAPRAAASRVVCQARPGSLQNDANHSVPRGRGHCVKTTASAGWARGAP